MNDSDFNVDSRDSVEVVRLRVDGASFIVNTLRDQQTARGLSLICSRPPSGMQKTGSLSHPRLRSLRVLSWQSPAKWLEIDFG